MRQPLAPVLPAAGFAEREIAWAHVAVGVDESRGARARNGPVSYAAVAAYVDRPLVSLGPVSVLAHWIHREPVRFSMITRAWSAHSLFCLAVTSASVPL